MNDRIQGSSYANPIWYGKWRIFLSADMEWHGHPYEFLHDDFDGAPDAYDSRYGIGMTVEECKALIDEKEGK